MTHPALTVVRSVRAARRMRRPSPPRRSEGGLDPFAPEVVADPASAYREVHDQGGVARCPARDLWLIGGHEQVKRAARAHAELSSSAGVSSVPGSLPMMLTADPPDHGRMRRLVAPHFTKRAVERWRPRIEQIADEALDRMLAAPGADSVAELAVPLPVLVIAEVLGLPSEDAPRLRRLSDGLVAGFEADGPVVTLMRGVGVQRGVVALHRYVRAAVRERRDAPGDDVLSLLIGSRSDGALDDDELFWFVLMLLVAGNETTTNLIGNLLLALADDPAGYARVRSEPDLDAAVVEEALRWGSPIQGMYRTALRPHREGDEVVPEGARALLLFAAANRDPKRYPEPDTFVVDRNPTDHLAFGWGIHYCLGAHLARLEAAVVLERLRARVAAMETTAPPLWSSNPTLRGPTRLALRLEPVAR